MKDISINDYKNNHSKSNSTKSSSSKKRKNIFSVKALFIILGVALLAFLAFYGYQVENGSVVNLKIGQIDANTLTTNGYYTGNISSYNKTSFVGVLDIGGHGTGNIVGNEVFAIMNGGKGNFYTNDINTDASNTKVIGYMNGYPLQESDLSGFDIKTEYRNENDSTYCEIKSIEISMKNPDTGILLYNIHNTSTFETIFNSYNIISGDGSNSILSKNSFKIPIDTKCDESLYIEPLYFIPAKEISDSEFIKSSIIVDKSGNSDQSQFLYCCDISTKNNSYKNGYCIYDREIVSGGLQSDNKHSASAILVTNGNGRIESTIDYNKDQDYFKMDDPQVEFLFSYYIPIKSISNY